MKHQSLFIDCEFNGFGGELISMALVPLSGEPFYVVLNFDHMKIEPWVEVNVIPFLEYNHRGFGRFSPESFRIALAKYLNQWDEVTVVADWPDDVKYFCQAIITAPGEMLSLPRLNFQIRRMNIDSKLPHNALADAEAVRAAYR